MSRSAAPPKSIEELVRLTREGGPRQRNNAWRELADVVAHDRPELIPSLLPQMVELAGGDPPDTAAWAAHAIGRWLPVHAALDDAQVAALVGHLGRTEAVTLAARRTTIGHEVALALAQVPELAGAQRALEARLDDRDRVVREEAAYGLAAGHRGLVLIEHDDDAIRKGARRRLTDEAHDATRASALLTRARELTSPRGRHALGEVVATALAPGRPPAEVKALVARLTADDAGDRAQVGALTELVRDRIDARWAAPFLAAALGDDDAGVRQCAAAALDALFDLTPHAVVQATRPAIDDALARETDPAVVDSLRLAVAAAQRS